MAALDVVSPSTFKALQNLDIECLAYLSENELRPILPCLVRMSLCAPSDNGERWMESKKSLLRILSGIEVVNSVVQLLSVDFHELEIDAKKEQHLRTKAGSSQSESMLISQLQNSLSLEFERADAPRRLRLVLSELLFVVSQMRETRTEFYHKPSELFECDVYLEEVADVICIAQAELPRLLPVTEVAEAMLHVKNGHLILCRLVANLPESFSEVCNSLISTGEKQDEDMPSGRRRMQAIRALCNMNPEEILSVRAMCLEHCKMPGLAVALTLLPQTTSSLTSGGGGRVTNDLVSFVSGILLGNDTNVRSWFAQFVKNGQKRKRDPTGSMLHAMRQKLLEQLVSLIPDSGDRFTEEAVVQASGFFRLYAALKGIAALKFSEEEAKLILRLITSHPPHNAAGVRFVSLAMSMLIASPSLLGTPEQERMAIDWIKGLIDEEEYYERKVSGTASFGELLLLIAIHFHSFQTNSIADLVCSTLGMKLSVKANSLARLKTIFTQEIFTEKVVAAHAIRVPVTPCLSASIPGFLPVHCISQLLKSRAFSKHKVPIRGWIYKQICSCSTPIHPLMPPLVDAYVNSIITPASKTDHTNKPFSEEEVLAVFVNSDQKNDQSEMDCRVTKASLPVQLLMTYYVMLYQDSLLSNMKAIVTSKRDIVQYSQHVVAKIPIKYLLQQAQKEQQQFAGLFAPLLKLIATNYPHLCLVEDWLQEEMMSVSPLPNHGIPVAKTTVESLQKGFAQVKECPSVLIMQLEYLLTLPVKSILPFAECIVGSLAVLLEDGISRRVLELVHRIWVQLNMLAPRRLGILTVNALRPHHQAAFKEQPYTQDNVTVDPLIVLRCDQRVFRCPPIFDLVLRVLSAFLQASRRYLSQHIQANPKLDKGTPVPNDFEREELKGALIAAQESAAVQILLECCLPRDAEKAKGSLLSKQREIQCLVCSHLHQMFIADPNLAKLVHFQGYPSELLPVTVAGIPSMHICLDFIPELISQPQIEKQVFAIELVSYLSMQYALPKSLGIAKLAVNVMLTLLGVLPCDVIPEFFLPTLPAMVRICQAFPPLHDDVTALLLQLGKVATANLTAFDNISTDINPVMRDDEEKSERSKDHLSLINRYGQLSQLTQKTFSEIVNTAVVTKNIY